MAAELLALRVAFDVPLRACGGLGCGDGSMAPDFLAEALRLRENAAAFLQDQVDRQSEALMEILSSTDGLRMVCQTLCICLLNLKIHPTLFRCCSQCEGLANGAESCSDETDSDSAHCYCCCIRDDVYASPSKMLVKLCDMDS